MKRTISRIVLYSAIGAVVLPLGTVEATNSNNIPTNLNTSSDISRQQITQTVENETDGNAVNDQAVTNDPEGNTSVLSMVMASASSIEQETSSVAPSLEAHVINQIIINGEEEEAPVIDLMPYILQAETSDRSASVEEESDADQAASETTAQDHNDTNSTESNIEERRDTGEESFSGTEESISVLSATTTSIIPGSGGIFVTALPPEANTMNQIIINGEGEAPVIDLMPYVLQAEASDRSAPVEEESDTDRVVSETISQVQSIDSIETDQQDEECPEEETIHEEDVAPEEEIVHGEESAEQLSRQVQYNDISAIQSQEEEALERPDFYGSDEAIGEPVFYDSEEEVIDYGAVGEPVFYNNEKDVNEEETVNEPTVQGRNEVVRGGEELSTTINVSPIIIDYEGEPVRERAVTLDDIDLNSVQERSAAVDNKTTPIFRGNVAAVEVAVGSNPSMLPEVEAIQTGKINTTTTRTFDLICTGKCDFSTTKDKLNIVSETKIPKVLTINSAGNVVFVNPSRMCTMQTPPGVNNWVNVVVESMKSGSSDAEKHVCLGIRRQGKSDYIDTLYAGHLTSTDFSMEDGDIIELVPRVSKTDVSSSCTYVTSGMVNTTSPAIPTSTPFDFGTVFRAKISARGHWVKKTCNLSEITGITSNWFNYGNIGVGPVTDVNGVSRGEQMLAINYNGTLAYSSDGATWIKTGLIGTTTESYWSRLAYGNGIWCAINYSNGSYGVRRSLNDGKDWSKTLSSTVSYNLGFGNDVFMAVNNAGKVYKSHDAEIWTQIGEIGNTTTGYALLYGNDQWVFVNSSRKVYGSKDGKGIWTSLDNSTTTTKNLSNVLSYTCYGGCYVNGYFYVINQYGSVASSRDGTSWTKVWDNGTSSGNSFRNITYFQNRFYVFSSDGINYEIGLPRPDGII